MYRETRDRWREAGDGLQPPSQRGGDLHVHNPQIQIQIAAWARARCRMIDRETGDRGMVDLGDQETLGFREADQTSGMRLRPRSVWRATREGSKGGGDLVHV